MNLNFANQILVSLAAQGVRDFCICPGARNAPLLEILSRSSGLNILSFFDERSASFFALGRARRDRRPVAVITTSGTAVAEMLPAAIEAYYTNTPLVLLSADRPKRLRGTGAPQSIEQMPIFAPYVEKSWDLSVDDVCDIRLTRMKPYHINLCFDEPLLTNNDPETSFEVGDPQFETSFEKSPSPTPELKKPLVVVGGLTSLEKENIAHFLQGCEIPIFLEATSGLRSHAKIDSLQGGEKIVSRLIESGEVESVVRIGDVPLGRYWRDLDQMHIPVYSFSNKEFSGTDKSEIATVDLKQWPGLDLPAWDWSRWRQLGHEKEQALQGLLLEYPKSEVAFFKKFASTLASGESVYIGNSLPIRLWDLVSDDSRPVHCNRGANGIDGQLSTAFGGMFSKSQNRIVVGDLTALYDFNGLWISSFLKSQRTDVELIVVNNGGGKIFSRIFANPIFQNNHQLSFQAMAEFWDWNYSRLDDPSLMRPSMGLGLTEWSPDEEQTHQFWQRYDELWKI